MYLLKIESRNNIAVITKPYEHFQGLSGSVRDAMFRPARFDARLDWIHGNVKRSFLRFKKVIRKVYRILRHS